MFTRTKNRFRPTLDALEARECLSASAFLDGHTLHVVGTEGNDFVRILQYERTNQITIDGSSVRAFDASRVSRFHIDLKGGDDTLFYQVMDGPAVTRDRGIDVNLGGGNDGASLSFVRYAADANGRYGVVPGGGLSIQAALNIRVDGGAGDDAVTADFGSVNHGHVKCRLFLGDDNDFGMVHLYGKVSADSVANLIVRGQYGDDTVAAWVESGAVIAGELRLKYSGGPGQDDLSVVQPQLGTGTNTAAAADSSALLAVIGEGGDDDAFGNPGAGLGGPAWFISRGERVGMP